MAAADGKDPAANRHGALRLPPGEKAKKGRPGWDALLSLAAAAVVVAAVHAAGVATAAVAEDQQQDDDPPPVVVIEAAADIVVAHKKYLRIRNFVGLCCPHSML